MFCMFFFFLFLKVCVSDKIATVYTIKCMYRFVFRVIRVSIPLVTSLCLVLDKTMVSDFQKVTVFLFCRFLSFCVCVVFVLVLKLRNMWNTSMITLISLDSNVYVVWFNCSQTHATYSD